MRRTAFIFLLFVLSTSYALGCADSKQRPVLEDAGSGTSVEERHNRDVSKDSQIEDIAADAEVDANAEKENDSKPIALPYEPECEINEDCKLVNTCCGCAALAVREDAPVCDDTSCESTICDGIVGPTDTLTMCYLGRCILAIECNESSAWCKMVRPDCPEGSLPSVTEGCYGPSVPTEDCLSVSSCADCPEDHVCVRTLAKDPFIRCVKKGRCAGSPTCECMGDSICGALGLPCIDSDEGIDCLCELC